MSSDNIHERTIRLLIKFQKLDEAIQDINDYGEMTGFCEEYDSIINSFDVTLGMFGKRSFDLLNRLHLWKQRQEEIKEN